MSSEIQRNVLGNAEDVLENTAGCPRISSEIQQNVSEIQGISSEIFTAGVLGNAECPRKCRGCPRKYSGMSSEIEWMSSEIHRMFSMTSEILFWGAQQLRRRLRGSEIFLGMSSKFCDVLENPKMSRIFSHVLENPKPNLSSKLQTFDAHLDVIFY